MVAQAVRLSNVDIDNALKAKDFEVLFQPIFDLANGALARVETFIRWRHQSLGVLPPGAFISFFETQGRMSELTRYVLAEALGAYENWRGPYPPGFSINLALTDLADESFASHFIVLLRERGFPAELVTLECPMPTVDANVATVQRQLQRLADTGARLAIEVRGRANDFLKTISPFPFHEIKTGGAAILRFARTVRGPGLSAISELLDLAAQQNAAITAVGVEDQASLAALRGLGFAAAQGNHLGKVGPLTQFMPSHVNDVRALLGLEPLSSDDLAALFRTGAPRFTAPSAPRPEPVEVDAQPVASAAPAADITPTEDELVERLAARIARSDNAGQRLHRAAPQAEPEDRKAAAIARARRASLAREKIAQRNALKTRAEAAAPQAAPRDMQERLSREFEAFADAEMPAHAQPAETAPEIQSAEETPDVAAAGAFTEPAPEPAPAAAEPEHGQPPPARALMNSVTVTADGARARFSPIIRIAGAELASRPPEYGVLRRGPAATPAPDAPEAEAAPEAAPDLAPAPLSVDIEDAAVEEIPTPAATTEWVEDKVAMAAAEPPARRPRRRRRRKTRYILGVIPYSGHFWPRPIRRMLKKRRAAKAAG
jgi:EAL domain-containing protein (putative c-di-GMP-specific phosphodiesterase class I)